MSRKLYYSTCSLLSPHIGVTIDDVLSSKKENDEIFWLFCRNALTSCQGNLNGMPCICDFCHTMYKRFKKEYGKNINMISIDKRNYIHHDHYWNYESVDDIKSIIYRNVQIGQSLLSLYIDYTRDLDVKKNEDFRSFFKPIVNDLCDFIDYAYDIINIIKPDEIITYNGRIYDNRLFYDIAKAMDIQYTSLEVEFGNGYPLKKVRFEGGLPHSIKINTYKILNLWDNSPLPDKKKVEIASSFYSRRRSGELIADVAVYILNQKKGKLPEGFDCSKRNIAIYNSSNDEFLALGGEWEDAVFPSQYEAIEYLLQHSSSDFHYYLRMHPHLKSVKYKAYLELYDLGKYNNLTIIPPVSEISTYSLMEACEKVVTFGSTMGVEASFWGKPSILLGRCFYENLDACYNVLSKEEVIPLIEKHLEPKSQIGSIKYAYYLMDREFKVDKTNIDIDIRGRIFLGWEFRFTSYFKIWGSQLLYQIAYFYHCILLPKFYRPSHIFPQL